MFKKGEAPLSHIIKEWISQVDGRFSTRQLDNDLEILTSQEKVLRRGVIKELCDDGKIERIASMVGIYRKIDTSVALIDWQHADPKNVLSVRWPFELEKYIKIFPKTIAIVAGGKDAGKTRFLHDFILLNMYHKLGIDFFNSETGKEQLRERFDETGIDIPDPAPFNVYERYDNFADVIDPDRISVIDYLDVNSEVYMVGEEIDRIFRKLRGGLALIGLQKPPPTVIYVRGEPQKKYRDLAYGGGFTAKRASLYLSLDDNKIKILIAKTPANPQVNPKNKMWSFWIEKGARFRNIKPYTGEDIDAERN